MGGHRRVQPLNHPHPDHHSSGHGSPCDRCGHHGHRSIGCRWQWKHHSGVTRQRHFRQLRHGDSVTCRDVVRLHRFGRERRGLHGGRPMQQQRHPERDHHGGGQCGSRHHSTGLRPRGGVQRNQCGLTHGLVGQQRWCDCRGQLHRSGQLDLDVHIHRNSHWL